MITYEEEQSIRKTEKQLIAKYPMDAYYNSKAGLWDHGLKDGLVSPDLYSKALEFYGRLWYDTYN